MIQGAQMLLLGECDVAIAGGVSESIRTFGIFASFKSQGALAWHDDPAKASRPFDLNRTGIVVAEGGCLYVLERLSDAKAHGARIHGELVGYAMNSDASDFVLPNPERQAQCMNAALRRAGITADRVDVVSTHATGTATGDAQECTALRLVFGELEPHADSTTRRALSAMPWEPPAHWNWRATCRRSAMAFAMRRSISTSPIRLADWTDW